MQKNTLLYLAVPHTSCLQDMQWGIACLVCAGASSCSCLGTAYSNFLLLQAVIPLKGRTKENLPRKSFSSTSASLGQPSIASKHVGSTHKVKQLQY